MPLTKYIIGRLFPLKRTLFYERLFIYFKHFFGESKNSYSFPISSLKRKLHCLVEDYAVLETKLHFKKGKSEICEKENVGCAKYERNSKVEVRISGVGVHPEMIDCWAQDRRDNECCDYDEIVRHEWSDALPHRNQ